MNTVCIKFESYFTMCLLLFRLIMTKEPLHFMFSPLAIKNVTDCSSQMNIINKWYSIIQEKWYPSVKWTFWNCKEKNWASEKFFNGNPDKYAFSKFSLNCLVLKKENVGNNKSVAPLHFIIILNSLNNFNTNKFYWLIVSLIAAQFLCF